MTLWQRTFGKKSPWICVRAGTFFLHKGQLLLGIRCFARSIRASVAMKGYYSVAAPLYLAELASALGLSGTQLFELAQRVDMTVLHPDAKRDIAKCVSRNASKRDSARLAIVALQEWLDGNTPRWFRELKEVLDAEWRELITEEQPMRVVSGIIEELRKNSEQMGRYSGATYKLKTPRLGDGSECDLHVRYEDSSGAREPGNAVLSLEIRCARLSDEPHLVPGFTKGLSRFLSKKTRVLVAPSGATRLVYERDHVLKRDHVLR